MLVLRGDTSNNEASDLTPILGGLEFPRAKGVVDESEVFGIKFEYIVTDNNPKTYSSRLWQNLC